MYCEIQKMNVKLFLVKKNKSEIIGIIIIANDHKNGKL